MKVTILSPYPQDIRPIIEEAGDTVTTNNPDQIICYGHRSIIRPPILSEYQNRIINLHLSFLPWNKGADPNFWSWMDNTRKGITLHVVDMGIDTGPIIAQRAIEFDNGDWTLASTYNVLRTEAVDMLRETWQFWKTNQLAVQPQDGPGSYHKSADRKMYAMPLGWQTPVKDVPHLNKVQ